MKLGLLWFDANPKLTPQRRLAEAATRYAERFGRAANCCHVHPEEVFTPEGQAPAEQARDETNGHDGVAANGSAQAGPVLDRRVENGAGGRKAADGEIVVVADPAVLRHHIWVGFDEAFAPEPARKRRSRRAAPPPTELQWAASPGAARPDMTDVPATQAALTPRDAQPAPVNAGASDEAPDVSPASSSKRSRGADTLVAAPTVQVVTAPAARRGRSRIPAALADERTPVNTMGERTPEVQPSQRPGRKLAKRTTLATASGTASLAPSAVAPDAARAASSRPARDASTRPVGETRRPTRDATPRAVASGEPNRRVASEAAGKGIVGRRARVAAELVVGRPAALDERQPRTRAGNSSPSVAIPAAPSAAEQLLIRRSRSRQGLVAEQPSPATSADAGSGLSRTKRGGSARPGPTGPIAAPIVDTGRPRHARGTETRPEAGPAEIKASKARSREELKEEPAMVPAEPKAARRPRHETPASSAPRVAVESPGPAERVVRRPRVAVPGAPVIQEGPAPAASRRRGRLAPPVGGAPADPAARANAPGRVNGSTRATPPAPPAKPAPATAPRRTDKAVRGSTGQHSEPPAQEVGAREQSSRGTAKAPRTLTVGVESGAGTDAERRGAALADVAASASRRTVTRAATQPTVVELPTRAARRAAGTAQGSDDGDVRGRRSGRSRRGA